MLRGLLSYFLFMQDGLLKDIEDKENEHNSFELQTSNLNLSHIDEREKNMVRMTYIGLHILSIV